MLISLVITALKFPAFFIFEGLTIHPFNTSRQRLPLYINQTHILLPRISTPVGSVAISRILDEFIYFRIVVPGSSTQSFFARRGNSFKVHSLYPGSLSVTFNLPGSKASSCHQSLFNHPLFIKNDLRHINLSGDMPSISMRAVVD